MKRRYGVIFAVLGFIVFFAIEARAVDWVPYGTSGRGDFHHYYNNQSIKLIGNDIEYQASTVQVWTKTIYSGKYARDTTKKLTPEKKELSHAYITLCEYNCREKKYRLLSTTFYNKDGDVEYSDNDPSSWGFVIPRSAEETLFNIVCGSR